jgi:hypothetical protein
VFTRNSGQGHRQDDGDGQTASVVCLFVGKGFPSSGVINQVIRAEIPSTTTTSPMTVL